MFGGKIIESCYVLLPCRWDSLLLGVVSAIAFRDAKFRAWLAGRLCRLQTLWWLLGAGSIALLFSSTGRLDPKLSIMGYTLIAWFACTLLLAVTNSQGGLHRFLGLRAFKPVATISYGLYLIQSPMAAVVKSFFRFAHIQYPQIGWISDGTGPAVPVPHRGLQRSEGSFCLRSGSAINTAATRTVIKQGP